MLSKKCREARSSPRQMTRRAAEVVFSGHERAIPCVIINFSNSGARLAIGHPTVAIPRTFTLILHKDRSALRDCKVVWIDRRYVGIKFVSGWHAPLRSGQCCITSGAEI